jgi:hypothetical protein
MTTTLKPPSGQGSSLAGVASWAKAAVTKGIADKKDMAMGQAETRAARVSSGLKFTRAAERQVGTGRVGMG